MTSHAASRALLVAVSLTVLVPVQVAHAAGTTTGADLQISGAASTGSPVQGQAFTITYQVKNAGPQTATGAMFVTPGAATCTDPLASFCLPITGATINGSASPCATDASGNLQCNLGDMASGSQVNVVESATAPPDAGLSFGTSSTVSSTVVDPNTANNTRGIVVKVIAGASTAPLTSGPCATMTVQDPPIIRISTNGTTSGTISLKANVSSCSTQVQSPLVLVFSAVPGDLFDTFSCVAPASPDGSATSFSLPANSTVGIGCNGQPYLVSGDSPSASGQGTATLYSGCTSWGLNPSFGATPCTNVLARGTYNWAIDTTVTVTNPLPPRVCPNVGCALAVSQAVRR